MTAKSSSRWPSQASEPPPEPDGAGELLPLDDVYHILSNARRRRALRHVRSADEVTLEELAEHIARLENETTVDQLTSAERKRAYVSLYQCHLPVLDEADVVDFDWVNKEVRPGESADQVLRLLTEQPAEGRTDDSSGIGASLRAAAARMSEVLR